MTNKTAFAKGWNTEVYGVFIKYKQKVIDNIKEKWTWPSILDR